VGARGDESFGVLVVRWVVDCSARSSDCSEEAVFAIEFVLECSGVGGMCVGRGWVHERQFAARWRAGHFRN
jgi:hypothetical protein